MNRPAAAIGFELLSKQVSWRDGDGKWPGSSMIGSDVSLRCLEYSSATAMDIDA